MKYSLYYSREARKDIEKLSKKIKERLLKSLQIISENPFSGKHLKGKLLCRYSLRIGTLRIIYSLEKKKKHTYIIKIDHRKESYR